MSGKGLGSLCSLFYQGRSLARKVWGSVGVFLRLTTKEVKRYFKGKGAGVEPWKRQKLFTAVELILICLLSGCRGLCEVVGQTEELSGQ